MIDDFIFMHRRMSKSLWNDTIDRIERRIKIHSTLNVRSFLIIRIKNTIGDLIFDCISDPLWGCVINRKIDRAIK